MKIYTWMTTVVALVSLGACQAPSGGSVADEAALASNAASEAAVVAEQATQQPVESPTPKKADMAKNESSAALPKPDLCWQDYCPCVQPVTALDHTICRNARACAG